MFPFPCLTFFFLFHSCCSHAQVVGNNMRMKTGRAKLNKATEVALPKLPKVVASHAEGFKVGRGYCPTPLLGRGYCQKGWGCDQSIRSTVSDAMVRSWLWSTATRSSPLGYFSKLLQVVDNDPTFCGSRFSTGMLLAIQDFTFTFMKKVYSGHEMKKSQHLYLHLGSRCRYRCCCSFHYYRHYRHGGCL